MPTIRLKGPGLNLWFAEMLVRNEGPEAALEKTCGPAREAVERVIAQNSAQLSTGTASAPEAGRSNEA